MFCGGFTPEAKKRMKYLRDKYDLNSYDGVILTMFWVMGSLSDEEIRERVLNYKRVKMEDIKEKEDKIKDLSESIKEKKTQLERLTNPDNKDNND